MNLHTDKVTTTLDYIKGLELQSGGIAGWNGAPAYPEVSGYLIPTLLDYGERELAVRLADWLVSIQNDEGSFCDMYGQKRSFDTAAVMEGLRIIGYRKAALNARDWLIRQVRKDGAVRITPENDETHLYTMRVSALLGYRDGAKYWMGQEWEDTREHYVAYALEGLWNMGYKDFVRVKLAVQEWDNDDLCANAQFAILTYQAGIDFLPYKYKSKVDLVNNNLGKLSNSWTAKWILDMWKVINAL